MGTVYLAEDQRTGRAVTLKVIRVDRLSAAAVARLQREFKAIASWNTAGSRGPATSCPDAVDADDNGQLELTDAVVILGQLFLSEARIAMPYPAAGRDETSDDLSPCGR